MNVTLNLGVNLFLTMAISAMSTLINPIMLLLGVMFIVGGIFSAEDSGEAAIGFVVFGLVLTVIGVSI